VPVRTPSVVGANVMLTVQLALAFRLVPHVLLATAKFPVATAGERGNDVVN